MVNWWEQRDNKYEDMKSLDLAQSKCKYFIDAVDKCEKAILDSKGQINFGKDDNCYRFKTQFFNCLKNNGLNI